MFIDNNDNDMTFFGNIVYLRPCSVICGPSTNATMQAQINNIPSKSHVILLLRKVIIKSKTQAAPSTPTRSPNYELLAKGLDALSLSYMGPARARACKLGSCDNLDWNAYMYL